MRKTIFIFFIIIFSIYKSSIANEHYYWVSLGIGASNQSFKRTAEQNLNLGISATYQFKKYLLSMESKITGEAYFPDAPYPYESTSNISLILSKYFKNDKLLLSMGLGPSYFTDLNRGKIISDNWPGSSEYEKLTSNHIGFVINTQFFLFGPAMGLGFKFSYNYFKEEYLDFLVCLHIGKLSIRNTES